MRPLRHLRVSALCLATGLLFFGPLSSVAQNVSDYQVKAAYLYNFTKFVRWPVHGFSGPAAPIQLCVLNDPLFQAELNRIAKGKTVAGRPVTVLAVQDAEESRSCHILFINSLQGTHARRILDALRQSSVLTVGESAGFTKEGGIINFLIQEDHVQFEVNHRAANEVGLQISSRLLSVAKLVIE